jgi:chromosome segregation ATPase
MREVRGSQAFLDAEGEEITKKVASSAAYAAKKKGCDVPEIYGTVARSFKDATDKQLEKRLRDGNEAQAYLDHYRESLGKKNATTLEKQADEIAKASYLVNVDMVDQMVQTRRLLQEGDQVKQTLQGIVTAESAYQAEQGHTDAEKQASHARSEKAKEKLSQLQSSLNQAREAEKNMQQQVKTAQKEYQDALAALLQAVGGKK